MKSLTLGTRIMITLIGDKSITAFSTYDNVSLNLEYRNTMKIKILVILFLGFSFSAFSQLSTPALSSPANALTIYVGSTVNFSWTAVTGATSYDVEFDAGMGYTYLTNVSDVTMSMLQSTSNIGSHTWHVRARNASGVSSWSASRSYSVVGVPAIPVTQFPQNQSNVQYGVSATFFGMAFKMHQAIKFGLTQNLLLVSAPTITPGLLHRQVPILGRYRQLTGQVAAIGVPIKLSSLYLAHQVLHHQPIIHQLT